MEPADYTYYLSFLQFLKRRNSSEGASQSTTLFRTAIWLCNQPISAPTHQPESGHGSYLYPARPCRARPRCSARNTDRCRGMTRPSGLSFHASAHLDRRCPSALIIGTMVLVIRFHSEFRTNRNDRLHIQHVLHPVVRTDPEICIVLQWNTGQVGHGILGFLGEYCFGFLDLFPLLRPQTQLPGAAVVPRG